MDEHSFDIHIATDYNSIELAILIGYFQRSIKENKQQGCNFLLDRTWLCESLEAIAETFPYWSKGKVLNIINKAVELGILRKGKFNAQKFERVNWYAFESEEKFLNRMGNQGGNNE